MGVKSRTTGEKKGQKSGNCFRSESHARGTEIGLFTFETFVFHFTEANKKTIF